MVLKRRRKGDHVAGAEGSGGKDERTRKKLYSTITPYGVAIVVLAVSVGVFHSVHLGILFENDRFFSHLSPLERELSFRTEMGLYYSYYKTIVNAPSFISGLSQIVWDNTTEYPSTINALRRFNLYPEVLLGAMFRSYRTILGLIGSDGVDCFTIRRGFDQPPVKTCTGMGELSYFYVYSVFALNGATLSGLFLLGLLLSDSVLGGIMASLFFLYNHGEATRVMWTPPLRESFALPFLTVQFLSLTLTLRHRRPSWQHFAMLTASSLAFLFPWQFSQFTLLTQTLCLLTVYSLRLISPHKFTFVLSSLTIALVCNVILQFGNTLLLTSYLPAALISCMLVRSLRGQFHRLQWLPAIAVSEFLLTIFLTLALKLILGRLVGSSDDAHIGAILLSKFTAYSDFHTQLYTCSPEFDFIGTTYPLKISLTLLLPAAMVTVVLVGGVMVWKVWRVWDVESDQDGQPELLYHTLQAAAFVVMATLIMRLKLFLTPQLAVLTSFLVLPKVSWCLTAKQRRWMVVFLILFSSLKGVHNLWEQWGVIGEFNNPDQEQLVSKK